MTYSFTERQLAEVADVVREADRAGAFLPPKDEPGFSAYAYLAQEQGEAGFHLFALTDSASRTVGFVTIRPTKRQATSYIGPAYVRDQYRGMGLGKLLFDRLIEWCKAHGVRSLYTNTWGANAATRRIFEGLGFCLVRESPDTRVNGDSTVYYLLDIDV